MIKVKKRNMKVKPNGNERVLGLPSVQLCSLVVSTNGSKYSGVKDM